MVSIPLLFFGVEIIWVIHATAKNQSHAFGKTIENKANT
jgi:hypothetical protein